MPRFEMPYRAYDMMSFDMFSINGHIMYAGQDVTCCCEIHGKEMQVANFRMIEGGHFKLKV